MIVVNKTGFPVTLKDKNGKEYPFPYNRQPVELPDCLFESYKEMFHVLQPPAPPAQQLMQDLEEKIEVVKEERIKNRKPRRSKKGKLLAKTKISKEKREELKKRRQKNKE